MTPRDGSALPAPIWGILLLQTGSGTWEEQPAFTSSNALGGADAVQPVQVQYEVGGGHSLTYYPGYPFLGCLVPVLGFRSAVHAS